LLEDYPEIDVYNLSSSFVHQDIATMSIADAENVANYAGDGH
jgi:hypothetical protein